MPSSVSASHPARESEERDEREEREEREDVEIEHPDRSKKVRCVQAGREEMHVSDT